MKTQFCDILRGEESRMGGENMQLSLEVVSWTQ